MPKSSFSTAETVLASICLEIELSYAFSEDENNDLVF